MPNRIIKESITTSVTLAQLSDAEERHFWRLLVQADDFGYLDARPEVIRARAYPLMLEKVSLQVAEARTQALVRVGLLHLFTSDRKRYGHFPTWSAHQQKRAQYRKYPQVESCDISCKQLLADDINGNPMLASAPEKRDIRNETLEARNEKRDTASAKPPPPAFQVPDDFQPLTQLTGYKKRNHSVAFANVTAECIKAGLPVAAVVRQFAADYEAIRLTYGWADPVAAFKGKPLAITISKLLEGRNNGQRNDKAQPGDASVVSPFAKYRGLTTADLAERVKQAPGQPA